MIVYVAISFVFGAAGAAAVWFWWQHRSHKIAQEIVAQAYSKAMNQAKAEEKAEMAQLPDPERPLDPKEVTDALSRLRASGRKPL